MSGFWGNVAGFGKGVGTGLWQGGKAAVTGVADLAKGGYRIATDANARSQAWETTRTVANRASRYAGEVYNDPAKAYRDARNGAAAMYSDFDAARQAAAARGESAEFWGNALGRGAFEVGATLIPVGAVAKAGHLRRAGRAANAVDHAADLATTGARARAAGVGSALPDVPICTKECRQKAEKWTKPASPARTKKGSPSSPVSRRAQYMGPTPDKYSRTGREVIERMRQEGKIVGEGPLLRGNPNKLQLRLDDGSLVPIDGKIDMAHKTDAVSWWNDVGRKYGPKSPEVRKFMLDSKNYELQPSSKNRAAGAKLDQEYLRPVRPEFDTLN